MQRPIKFRAWDGISKLMWEDVTFDFSHIFCDNGTMPRWDTNPLMQYTGLKDKNNVEIYEEDIVRWNEDELDEPTIEEIVEYKGGAFYPICEQPENEFEVIGNTFEDTAHQ